MIKKNAGVNKTRKFGVEIEFFGVHYNKVMTELKAEGIQVEWESWTPHHLRDYTRATWKLTTDGSVPSEGTGLSSGLELVSSPMTMSAGGFEEIKKVSKVLSRLGAKVNKQCGLHVHHDAADFDLRAFQQIFAIYVRYENALDELVPMSRRHNNAYYCKTMNARQSNETTEDTIRRVLGNLTSVKDLNEFANIYSGRYHKLNFQSYIAHGTVEFRQHSGTIDADKIIHWIVLTQAMVERATSAKVQVKKSADTNISTKWFDFKKIIRAYKWMGADEILTETIEYYNKRRRELSKKYGVALAD